MRLKRGDDWKLHVAFLLENEDAQELLNKHMSLVVTPDTATEETFLCARRNCVRPPCPSPAPSGSLNPEP